MCGIAGLWRFDQAVSTDDVWTMTSAMTHRGPDSWGCAFFDSEGRKAPVITRGGDPTPNDRNVAFGHRRLSIIDLSPLGSQPMTFGSLTISYNGEIYNYLELAEELKRVGHTFISHSDTEVLLHAWAEWGPDSLSRLNGIFAFLLWDARSGSLFAARDRLGVKPLHYVRQPAMVAFASEIKGILALPGASAEANESCIFDFLAAGHLDHMDDTMFRGISRLPAGSVLEVERSGSIKVSRYWNLPTEAQESGNFLQAAERFGDLFRDSVKLQMRADVPVACCLSGGIDSSSIVSIAAGLSPYRLKAFTARFTDPTMDEWQWVKIIHEAKPIDPIAIVVQPEEFLRELPTLTRAQEEPFGGPSVFAQWTLMKRIRQQGIRVVLDGQGGDEILCGYAKYFYYSLIDLIKAGRYVAAAKAALSGLLRGGPQILNWDGAQRYLPRRMGKKLSAASLLEPEFGRKYEGRLGLQRAASTTSLQFLDITTNSLPVLLRYEDRNSMAHSIESRVPFLDHRLVEFAVGLPGDQKIRGALTKLVLREGLRKDVPGETLRRRSKLGFGGTYRSWIEDLRPQLREWTNQRTRPVDRFVRPWVSGQLLESGNPLFFRVLILDSWMTEFGIS